jgi:hypothetical protein
MARTGWRPEEVGRSYAHMTRYKDLQADDVDEDTWVDIINRQGRPYVKNAGILRSGAWSVASTGCRHCS